jgi:hypothetical protein
MVGHRLVIEARDDMQVGVEPALIVPAEGVAVGSEPLVQLGPDEKQTQSSVIRPFYSRYRPRPARTAGAAC